MTNEFIFRMIQLFLIFLTFWTVGNILVGAEKYSINLKEKFRTGLWIGYVTDLLDTLGVGTFATSTALFKATKLVKGDKKVPTALSATHIIPVLIEALYFITIVEVDLAILFVMAMTSSLGVFVETRITKNWGTRQAQRVLGILLVIAAFIMIYRLIASPGTNTSESAHDLHGIWTLVGVMFSFMVSVLVTMGLGDYASELISFSMLGTNPSVTLPVMMLDTAVIMPTNTTDFTKSGCVNWPGVLGIIIGGSFGVLTAVSFLNKLDTNHFKILIVFIALFTGASLLRSSVIRR